MMSFEMLLVPVGANGLFNILIENDAIHRQGARGW